MKNINISVSGNIATVSFDMTKSFGKSGSGKTIVIASTAGNVSVPGAEHVKLVLTAYKYPDSDL